MKGVNHLLLTHLTLLPIIITFWLWEETLISWIILFLISLTLGVLLVDSDMVEGTLIENETIPFGKEIKMFVNSLLKVLLIFLQSKSKEVGRLEEHRGILHSVHGIAYIDGFLSIMSFFILLSLFFLQGVTLKTLILSPFIIFVGLFTGGIMHLLQDTLTRQGVCWWCPKKDKRIRGKLIVGSEEEETLSKQLQWVLGVISFISFLPIVIGKSVLPYTSILSLVLPILVWARVYKKYVTQSVQPRAF